MKLKYNVEKNYKFLKSMSPTPFDLGSLLVSFGLLRFFYDYVSKDYTEFLHFLSLIFIIEFFHCIIWVLHFIFHCIYCKVNKLNYK